MKKAKGRQAFKTAHRKKKGAAPHRPDSGFDASGPFASMTKKGPGKRNKATAQKIAIKGSSTKQGELAAGHHKLNALQKHQGIVKPKMAKKMESIEKWIKKRNLGELARKGGH